MDSDQRSRIEQLYTEMYDFLIHYAVSALKNESLAEEAVQETFRIACAKPEALLAKGEMQYIGERYLFAFLHIHENRNPLIN
jgi:DNA-directed RNA polymerase specialized sigma24 family protein